MLSGGFLKRLRGKATSLKGKAKGKLTGLKDKAQAAAGTAAGVGAFTTATAGLSAAGIPQWVKAVIAILGVLVVVVPLLVLYFKGKLGFKNKEPFADVPIIQSGPQRVDANNESAYLTNLQMMTTRVPPPLKSADLISLEKSKIAIEGYISNSLNSGSRTFFLDIDFNKNINDSNPMLIYRNGNDAVKNNYCKIEDAMNHIQTIGFGNGIQGTTAGIPNYKLPIIIILNIVRTPFNDPIKNTTQYNKYLDKIANSLKPFEGSLLGQTPIGDFRYHQKEELLIKTPIINSNFSKKFIILSNANVSLYKSDEIGNTHLNHYVHLRYFLDDPNQQSVGITLPPIMTDPPKAVISTFGSLANKMTTASKQSWIAGHSSIFTIALPMMSSPMNDENMLPILEMGINSIPTYIMNKKPTAYWGAGTPFVLPKPQLQG